jgi:hypothetical protein
MTTQNQSNDILAKLLAHENLNIVRGSVRTASFDIRNRVLILPRWKDMTTTCEQMLILHEVGHALFTSEEKYGEVFKAENKHLRGYANVIEDVRIENKMKLRYPGCRKTFTDGYKELRDRDFFEIKNRDINSFLLIDRINLFYKIGYNAGVRFTAEETLLLSRVDKCNTEEDVLTLAREIYEFSKSKKEESNSLDDLSFDDENNDIDIDGDIDGDIDDDGDTDTSELDDETFGSTSKKSAGDFEDGIDPELQPETLDTLESNLSDSTDDTLRFQYFEPDFEVKNHNNSIIIGYSRVLSELKGSIESHEYVSKTDVQNFKSSTSSMVNYMIKEFEMKKSASAFKRAKISKLGQLNSNKLYAYKLKDDLFRQVMTVKDGKKHGMIFMLDWSGSMCNNIAETVEQVINLAMFCQKSQIPYQVFAFTDGYCENDYYSRSVIPTNENGIGNDHGFNLLEFFSSKMTNSEFNAMISLMMNRPWRFNRYGLNGTPLGEATMFMIDYIGKFKKENQVEKMSFITLTDGEGNHMYNTTRTSADSVKQLYEHGVYKTIKNKCILRDPITKHEYSLGENSCTQNAALRSLIQDRYDCKVIGFYIMSPSRGEMTRFYKNNMQHIISAKMTSEIDKSAIALRTNKYNVVENMPGYNDFYMLASTTIKEHELEVTSEMSAAAISRSLTKAFNTRKVSRVVLNKFIEKIS